MKRSLLAYLHYVLLAKLGPRTLRNLLWRRRKPSLLVSNSLAHRHGIVFVSPTLCICKAFLPGQLVRLVVGFQSAVAAGKPLIVERIMKIDVDVRLRSDKISISRNDYFNVFGAHDVVNAVVEDITPTSVLRLEKLEVAESLKVARIQQNGVGETQLSFGQIEHFLRNQSVVYSHDIICIERRDSMLSTRKVYYRARINAWKGQKDGRVQLDCSPSPCIVDSSTNVYETTACNSGLPFGGFAPPFQVHDSLRRLVRRMTVICLAFRETREAGLAIFLTGGGGSGKRLASKLFAAQTHQGFFEANAYDLVTDVSAQSEARVRSLFEKVSKLRPCVLYLANSNVLGYDQITGADQRVLSYVQDQIDAASKVVVVLACSSDKVSQVAMTTKSLALYSLNVDYMDESDRRQWLTSFFDEELVKFAVKKTSGFSLAELVELVSNVNYKKRAKHSDVIEQRFLEWAIDKRNSNFADAIGAPKIPNVEWNDVGGLEETKLTVVESIRASLYGSQALKRSGIILYGAPGCGKTLIAKAVATEFRIAFLSVKGPELLNKYVGQSEENLRKVFERARQASPCVIFFDEIDSLAPNRGKNGDSGGVIDRIVSQLLAELDKLHNSPRTKVFVMGATNRPDLLDPSLLTPGRFDKMVEVSPGKDVESKTKILEAISRKMKFDADVDLRKIAENCDDVMSGAQLFSLISNAAMNAIIEKVEIIEKEGLSTKDVSVQVTQRHLLQSLDNLKTSRGVS